MRLQAPKGYWERNLQWSHQQCSKHTGGRDNTYQRGVRSSKRCCMRSSAPSLPSSAPGCRRQGTAYIPAPLPSVSHLPVRCCHAMLLVLAQPLAQTRRDEENMRRGRKETAVYLITHCSTKVWHHTHLITSN